MAETMGLEGEMSGIEIAGWVVFLITQWTMVMAIKAVQGLLKGHQELLVRLDGELRQAIERLPKSRAKRKAKE